jgi:hypothetical protein
MSWLFLTCGHLPTVDCDFFYYHKLVVPCLNAADLSLGGPCVGPFSNDFVTRYCYIPRNRVRVSARGLGCQAYMVPMLVPQRCCSVVVQPSAASTLRQCCRAADPARVSAGCRAAAIAFGTFSLAGLSFVWSCSCQCKAWCPRHLN